MKTTRATRTIALTFCIITLTACSASDTKKKNAPQPVPVTAAKASMRDIPVTLQVVGRAEAFETVTLKARIDGQVAAVLYAEGQHVKRGDVLIRLDPADYVARLQQAESVVARDTALIAKARADTARYAMLKERKFVSEEKVNDIRTSESTASANQRASVSATNLARLQLSYTTIRAPIDGVVGARVVFPGTAVKNNDTVLAVINRARPLLVSFTVPEKHLPLLRAAFKASQGIAGGMRANIGLPGDTAFQREGQVRFIDNAVDSSTGTILMKAELPNDDEQLTPGQFLKVTILISTLKNAVTVPDEAIQQGADGNYAYVVKDDSSVEMRPVEISASHAGMTSVVKGLQVGETVVTDGQLRLEPKIKVKIKSATAETQGKPDKPEGGDAASSSTRKDGPTS